MTNNQKRQGVYRQMFTLNVMNQIVMMSLNSQIESIEEVVAYLDHHSQQLATKAKLTVEVQEQIIAACHDRLANDLRTQSDSESLQNRTDIEN